MPDRSDFDQLRQEAARVARNLERDDRMPLSIFLVQLVDAIEAVSVANAERGVRAGVVLPNPGRSDD